MHARIAAPTQLVLATREEAAAVVLIHCKIVEVGARMRIREQRHYNGYAIAADHLQERLEQPMQGRVKHNNKNNGNDSSTH